MLPKTNNGFLMHFDRTADMDGLGFPSSAVAGGIRRPRGAVLQRFGVLNPVAKASDMQFIRLTTCQGSQKS